MVGFQQGKPEVLADEFRDSFLSWASTRSVERPEVELGDEFVVQRAAEVVSRRKKR